MVMAEDSELAIRVADGDSAALAIVYDRYADRLFDFCNSMLRDREEAADTVQQCFLIAAEKMGSLREPSKMRAWLYAVARHDCLRRIRRRSREVVSQETAATEAPLTLSDEVADVQSLQELVWSAAKGLAPKDQALLDLHVRQGLNGQELAEAVGVKPSNVYVMVNRLKAQFERAMGALLVMRLASTDCRELEAILEGSGTEFTVLVRKRVVRHIEGCDICEDNRRRLASPIALLAAVPIVPAPLLLRARVLRNWPSAGHGPPEGVGEVANGAITKTSAQVPKLSGRTGFPKAPSASGLMSIPVAAVAVVVVAAAIVGVTLSAPASTVTPRPRNAHLTQQAPFTSISTLPPGKSGKEGQTTTATTANHGTGAIPTTVPRHGTTTSGPPQGLTTTTVPQNGSTSTTQAASSTAAGGGPVCPVGIGQSVAMVVSSDGGGYWVIASNGAVAAYGDATPYAASSNPSAPFSSASAVSGSSGYVLLASDGTVVGMGASAEGSATSVGSSCNAVAIRETPDGHGYWIALSSGAVLTFGEANSYGSALGNNVGAPIVGMASTPDGKGYWLVAANGAVITFGDAVFHGSMSGSHLNAPIVGMASTSDGNGYWLVGADGGLFAYGDASFLGSPAPSSSPVVGLSVDPGGTGYWFLEANGQVMPYGSAESYPPA
jgi:RNA polymerase sigma factor (sigma-70 family)